MSEIIVHRGTKTIGGNCVEIRSNRQRLLIDLGTPLMAPGGGELDENDLINPSVENGILPDIKGLYKGETPDISAIFISHAHIDHYGLLSHIHPEIPVYISKGTKALIDIGRIFYPDQNKTYFDNHIIFEHWKFIDKGPFKVTSYLMDHSGFDASSFLIEVNNKKIFYSGDFRGHGRKSKLFNNIIQNPIPDIDCMLLEGTTLGGNHNIGFDTEKEIEKGFFEIFLKQKDISFVAAAGSNIDRMVSLYKAARNSNKTLVLDLYTYYVLDQLKKIAPGLPPFHGDNVRIFYIKGHAENIVKHLGKRILYKYKHRKIDIDEMITKRKDMILKLPLNSIQTICSKISAQKSLEKTKFIYSMWQGYLEKDQGYLNLCNDFKIQLIQIHTSGHAYIKDLKSIVEAFKPKKIVPIHTISSEEFKSNFNNVRLYDDSIPFSI